MLKTIIAKQIKKAREIRGLSQKELALHVGFKSHTSIVSIEQGKQEPKMWELFKIAEFLRVPVDSLYNDVDLDALKPPQILWRQKGPNPKAIKLEEQNIYQYSEDYHLLERLVEVSSFSKRELPYKKMDIHNADYKWVNCLADEVARELNLGDFPAGILAKRLEEDFGTLIFCRPLENGSAACLRTDNEAIIALNESEIPWRQMFSLAHELFHLVTWDSTLLKEVESDKSLFQKNEKLADDFAAALLMPAQMIDSDLQGKKLTYSRIVTLARKYGVSSSAMLWRLCHLRFLSSKNVLEALEDPDFKQLNRTSSGKALSSTCTIGDKFLGLAYLAFEEGRLSKARLAKMLHINLRDLDEYLSTKGFELTNDKEITTNSHPH